MSLSILLPSWVAAEQNVSSLAFNIPFPHEYGYIRDDAEHKDGRG